MGGNTSGRGDAVAALRAMTLAVLPEAAAELYAAAEPYVSRGDWK